MRACRRLRSAQWALPRCEEEMLRFALTAFRRRDRSAFRRRPQITDTMRSNPDRRVGLTIRPVALFGPMGLCSEAQLLRGSHEIMVGGCLFWSLVKLRHRHKTAFQMSGDGNGNIVRNTGMKPGEGPKAPSAIQTGHRHMNVACLDCDPIHVFEHEKRTSSVSCQGPHFRSSGFFKTLSS